jgi:hypothetical protein
MNSGKDGRECTLKLAAPSTKFGFDDVRIGGNELERHAG